MTAFDLRLNQSAEVVNIGLQGAAAERLASLGLKRGTEIKALSFSLFKGSVLLGFGAARLALRKSVAQLIEVKI